MSEAMKFVWRKGNRGPTREVISADQFNKPGPDSKAYLPEVLAAYDVPPEIAARIEAGETGLLDELAVVFPPPPPSQD